MYCVEIRRIFTVLLNTEIRIRLFFYACTFCTKSSFALQTGFTFMKKKYILLPECFNFFFVRTMVRRIAWSQARILIRSRNKNLQGTQLIKQTKFVGLRGKNI